MHWDESYDDELYWRQLKWNISLWTLVIVIIATWVAVEFCGDESEE
jgi:hypothetical protein